jgi:hypothetical protein
VLIIDFYNIEELVFNNQDIRYSLNKYFEIFNDWVQCKIFGNRSKINQLKIDLLNKLTEEDIEKISNYYNYNILIKKNCSNITNNIVFDLNNFDSFNIESYKDFCIFRDAEKVFMTCWR